MIQLQQGNLLEADAEALVNTVNCVGVMGKGIALQFKHAYPANFKEYEKACKEKIVNPGMVLTHPTGKLINPKFIINFPSKRHWKGKSRIEDIRDGLIALVAEVRRLGIKSIAVPPLGCGNGGLPWSKVKPMIESAFVELPNTEILLYEPVGAPETIIDRTPKPKMTRSRAILIKLLDAYRGVGYELTHLEIQKLAYFIQEAGEEMKLRFEAGNYGPYADNLRHVLDKLSTHYIEGFGDGTGEMQLKAKPEAIIAADAFLGDHPDAAERLRRLVEMIERFETPFGLELLATVHWLAVHGDANSRRAVNAESAVELVRSWNQRKEFLFKPFQIEVAWERLREQHWLPNPGAIPVSA